MYSAFRKYKLSLIFPVLLAIAGCASLTEGPLAVFYHDMTAHYNAFYNANEIMKTVVTQTEETSVDDYNGILKLYRFPDEKSEKTNSASVDKILKKCASILEKHKISHWIDDTYFLIGKSYFYKGDYYSALQTFQYLSSKYKGTDIGYQSILWSAFTLIQQKLPDDALAMLTLLRSEKNLPPELAKDLFLTDAFINIQSEDYVSAISNLKKAIPKIKKKYEKTRAIFVLAQIYQLTGDKKLAAENYEKVIKRNPPYEMAFNAKIELTRSYSYSTEREAKPMLTQLNKMLKDDKNIQYQDQIYFEMALIYLKLNQPKEAEKYLKLCIENSKNNANQKAIAFLKLAEYYFDEKNYILSKAYYDSTTQSLTNNYPKYDLVIQRTKILTSLVKYLVVVETQDSLQKLAKMTPARRDSIINAAYMEELRIKKEKEQKVLQTKMLEDQELKSGRDMIYGKNIMQPPSMSFSGSDKWYFYNPAAVTIGQSEFLVKWGKRILEDDWRRKNKNTSALIEVTDSTEEEIEETPVISEADQKIINEQTKNKPKELQKYYVDIPFTESLVTTSNNRIIDALKNAGYIFLEQLYDTTNAIEKFNDLLTRFPENKYSDRILYQLYNIYLKKGNNDKSEEYKNKILKDYPESDYAMLINDPEYFSKQIKTTNVEVDSVYNLVYNYFIAGNCTKTAELTKAILVKYPKNSKKSHFEYLSLLCKGKSMDKEEFKKELTAFISKTKDKELIAHAETVFEYLSKEEKTSESTKDSVLLTSPYLYDQNASLLFIYAFQTKKFNSSDIKNAFSDFNSTYYELAKLNTNLISIDKETQLVIVGSFDSKEKAQKYQKNVVTDTDFQVKIKNTKPESMLISQDNLTILLKEKDLSKYKTFYQKFYLK